MQSALPRLASHPIRYGRAWVVLALLLLLGSGLWAMRESLPLRFAVWDPYACQDCNVILIVLDDLRADHVGAYGHDRNTTSNMDPFAAESVLFETAVVQGTISPVSGASILTSTYPMRHGVQASYTVIRPDVPTLAEELRNQGYTTGAVMSNVVLASAYGYAQGFEEYLETYTSPQKNASFDKEYVFGLAEGWLEKHKKEKFFLLLWDMGPHGPYEAPAPFAEVFDEEYHQSSQPHFDWGLMPNTKLSEAWNLGPEPVSHIVAHYDNRIAYTDDYVGQLLEKIRALRLEKRTLVIITADHGEEFWEYPFTPSLGHGTNLKAITTNVPLLMRFPSKRPLRIREQVALIDIGPTVLDLLGLSVPSQMEGVSLQDVLRGGTRSSPFIFSEIDQVGYDLKSVRTDHHKLVLHLNLAAHYNYSELELVQYADLFDVQKDPLEFNDLLQTIWVEDTKTAVEDTAMALQLRDVLLDWMAGYPPTQNRQIPVTDPRLLDELKALGYLE